MMYEDYFKNIVGGNYDSPEYYMANYNPYPTYMNNYNEEYIQYENDMYNMNNDYNRFVPRQVSAVPYYDEYQESQRYIEVSNMYPEIYKKIEPVLEKVLSNKDLTNINREELDKLTFEIYDKVEKEVSDSDMNLGKSKTTNQTNSFSSTKTNIPTTVSLNNKISPNKSTNINNKDTKEVVTSPRRNNNLLSDLIRILILNKIIGNRPRPPFRPSPNPRPPFPGQRPPFQGNIRPPFPGNNQRPQPRFNQSGPGRQVNAPMSYFDVPYPEE